MKIRGKAKDWLMRNRASVRVAFGLRLFAMAAGSLFSLFWFRLLSRAMGDSLYGLFLTFQAVTRLGGLGDLGMSGAIAVKGGLMLGRREDDALQKLLASARSLFLLAGGLLFILFAFLSPWLPGWLGFRPVPGSGSLTLLFIYGGASAATFVIIGYFHSLNYAYGTVTWPILPTVFLGQMLAPFAHWELALWQAPLWVQNTPYLAASILNGWLVWRMLKWSHPWLGNLRPLEADRGLWKTLAGASGWIYLSTLGSTIYVTVDRLVINAKFGPAIIPSYQANYKVCDLAFILITTASFVSLPKITQWISGGSGSDRERLLAEINRLNVFQTVLGCAAALGYLALNDLFIRFWLGAAYQAPLAWQLAFACTLAVGTGGDAGIQIASRCGDRGLRSMGLTVGVTGLLNLALSILSASLGSVTGVAVATVVAQSVLSLVLGRLTSRHLQISPVRWAVRSWLLPLGIVLAAGLVKAWKPAQSASDIGTLLGIYAVLLLTVCKLGGMNKEMLRSEWTTLRSTLKF